MPIHLRMLTLVFTLVITLASQTSVAAAEPDLVSVQGETGWQRVNDYVVTLHDPTNQLQISDIAKVDIRNNFAQVPLEFGNQATTKIKRLSAGWIPTTVSCQKLKSLARAQMVNTTGNWPAAARVSNIDRSRLPILCFSSTFRHCKQWTSIFVRKPSAFCGTRSS